MHDTPLIEQRRRGELVCQLLLDGHDPRSRPVEAAVERYSRWRPVPTPCLRGTGNRPCATCADEQRRIAALAPVISGMYLLYSADTFTEEASDRYHLARHVAAWAAARGHAVEPPDPELYTSHIVGNIMVTRALIEDVVDTCRQRIDVERSAARPRADAIADWTAIVEDGVRDERALRLDDPAGVKATHARYVALAREERIIDGEAAPPRARHAPRRRSPKRRKRRR